MLRLPKVATLSVPYETGMGLWRKHVVKSIFLKLFKDENIFVNIQIFPLDCRN